MRIKTHGKMKLCTKGCLTTPPQLPMFLSFSCFQIIILCPREAIIARGGKRSCFLKDDFDGWPAMGFCCCDNNPDVKLLMMIVQWQCNAGRDGGVSLFILFFGSDSQYKVSFMIELSKQELQHCGSRGLKCQYVRGLPPFCNDFPKYLP